MDQPAESKKDDIVNIKQEQAHLNIPSEERMKEMIVQNKKRTYELYQEDVDDNDLIQEIDDRRIAVKF